MMKSHATVYFLGIVHVELLTIHQSSLWQAKCIKIRNTVYIHTYVRTYYYTNIHMLNDIYEHHIHKNSIIPMSILYNIVINSRYDLILPVGPKCRRDLITLLTMTADMTSYSTGKYDLMYIWQQIDMISFYPS